MPNSVSLEITLCGKRRPLRLPRIGAVDVTPAMRQLDWWRQSGDVSDQVADEAAKVLDAIAKAST